MAITIDQESLQRKRSPIDIDNMGQRYKTDSEYYTFTSPSLWVLEKHLFYLLRNSKQVDFEQQYKMRPDYLSFDEYGTVILAQLLMYVNGVMCIEEFSLDTVVIPTFQSIMDITRDKFSRDFLNIDTVDW